MDSTDPPPAKGEGGPQKTAPRVITDLREQLLAQLTERSNPIRMAVAALSAEELRESLQAEHQRLLRCRRRSEIKEARL